MHKWNAERLLRWSFVIFSIFFFIHFFLRWDNNNNNMEITRCAVLFMDEQKNSICSWCHFSAQWRCFGHCIYAVHSKHIHKRHLIFHICFWRENTTTDVTLKSMDHMPASTHWNSIRFWSVADEWVSFTFVFNWSLVICVLCLPAWKMPLYFIVVGHSLLVTPFLLRIPLY